MTAHKGDKGETSRYNGDRVPKDDQIIKVTGLFDFFLSALDDVVLKLESDEHRSWIENIETKLWQSAGEVSLGTVGKKVNDYVQSEDMKQLETYMGTLTPLPNQFVRFTKPLPIAFNEARVRCRMLEVELTPLLRESKVREELYTYVNRLSLFLFHMAYHYEKKD